jgi:mono/diheme cytochrome c family protein
MDHLGRTFGQGLLVWSGVAAVVFLALRFAFPHQEPAFPVVEPSCKAALYAAVDQPEPAQAVLDTPSACATGSQDPRARLHAWLDGAELPASPTEPPPTIDASLRARGSELYTSHCARCHGATGGGDGPDACALMIPPAVHASGVFALRTTEHEALPTDEDLFRTITRGVHGTAMPPWFELPERDRWALVAHVKSLSKAFQEDTAPPPIAAGTPPAETPERVAHGRKLFTDGGCASCHGTRGMGDGPAAGAFSVPPRDFTSGRFHRGSTVADIHETLVTGLDGTPMASFAKVMTADDLWDVSLYVHSFVPAFDERNGLRCPTTPGRSYPQELLAIRAVLLAH